MAPKRAGNGGNSSTDPRGNLEAHRNFEDKFNSNVKTCTALLEIIELKDSKVELPG